MVPPARPEIKGTLQEIKGNLLDSPFAELLTETSQARLSGSFRFSQDDKKAIVYLKNGEVVFAVSNLRQHRLFDILLESRFVSKEDLLKIPNFTNDLELGLTLVREKILTREIVERLFHQQITEILKSLLQWKIGLWTFSHLARAKENIQCQIDTNSLLLEYSRNLSNETIIRRFKSFEEKFATREMFSVHLNLLPQEAYVFSRLSPTFMKVQEIAHACGLAEMETLKTLYILWLGNFISRKNWNSTFSDYRIREMLSAKLTLKKEVVEVVSKTPVQTPAVKEPPKTVETNNVPLKPEEPVVNIDERKSLEKYLETVENAASYYEILNVPIDAQVSEIKSSYFKLAKNYHPDRFHQETDAKLQQRVQNAFTEIARSYETLKDDSAREVYDYKLRKYLESIKDQTARDRKAATETDVDKAREEFDQGFDYLMEEDYEMAIPFLTRAVNLSPDNARFHAYFGKALSFITNQRHKAESEIQAAIKLDSGNPTYRIMLAEFYIQFNLLKRAEGELQRLLVQFPNNKEAETLLDSLVN